MPTAVVIAIATAPKRVTRAIPIATFAPPICADSPPKKAKQTSEPTATDGIIQSCGLSKTSRSGQAAPTEKVAEDAIAQLLFKL